MTRKQPKRRYAGRLASGLHEAIGIERGQLRAVAITRRVVTARDAKAAAAPAYSACEVRDIRYKLALSQPVFAQALNVSPETVRAWEQGKKQPGGPAARLLEIARTYPDLIRNSLETNK